MIKLAVSGCLGRMGQSITRLALQNKEFKLMTVLEYKGHPQINQKVNGLQIATDTSALKGNDILIEFTTPQATIDHLKACEKHGVKMVIGTTGLNDAQKRAILSASKKIAIVFSSNMSIGVNLLFKLTELTASQTRANYVINMSEAHHIHKKDAPSGTAKTIAEIAQKASGQKVANIEVIRAGEIIGDHKIIFESEEDIITIAHHAKNRDIFAKGALAAAKFLAAQKSGLFTMQDVLGLK